MFCFFACFPLRIEEYTHCARLRNIDLFNTPEIPSCFSIQYLVQKFLLRLLLVLLHRWLRFEDVRPGGNGDPAGQFRFMLHHNSFGPLGISYPSYLAFMRGAESPKSWYARSLLLPTNIKNALNGLLRWSISREPLSRSLNEAKQRAFVEISVIEVMS